MDLKDMLDQEVPSQVEFGKDPGLMEGTKSRVEGR